MEKCVTHSFSESGASLAKTTPVLLPGELVDEQDEQHPELYAVPITPPNLSISGKDIGLKPMSLEDFRKKIKSFQNSERWNEFKTDEGVIENERADILADRINELLSNRKQKFMYRFPQIVSLRRYKEFQKFIMLPSPVTRQSLIKMLRVIDKELGEVSPSLLPWIESYFNGTEFPKAGEEKKEIQMQLDILTKVTEKFFRDWEYFLYNWHFTCRNIQYDGFQWRVNVVRDCLESYCSDDELNRLFSFLNSFTDSSRKAISFSQFLTRIEVENRLVWHVVDPQTQSTQLRFARVNGMGHQGTERIPADQHLGRSKHGGSSS